MSMTREDLQVAVEDGSIDTVVAAFTDMQGRLIGKRVTGRFFMEKVIEEWHACDYLLACDMDMEPVPGFEAASWGRGYGDFAIRPDLSTLMRTPWLPGTAVVLGDVVDHDGRDLPHSPRAVLKRQIARVEEHGLHANMASELEFYVFDDSFAEARDKRYHELATTGWYIEDYHVLQSTKIEPLLRTIRNQMEAAGIPVEFSKGEWGPGQHELNLTYADALTMADRHVVYKNGVKEIACLQGKAVTFMPKWRADLAGNSCHVHCSLVDGEGRAVFEGEGETFRRFLAGMLAVGRDPTFFLAPSINAYKRFQAASFAPTNMVWSRDNRTSGFRVLGHGPATRIECRVPGGDANPYLAFAALLAAGLHGVENALDLEPAFEGDAYGSKDIPTLPTSLHEAVGLLDASAPLRAAMGDTVIDHYVHAGRWEQRTFDQAVTDWELMRYFERS